MASGLLGSADISAGGVASLLYTVPPGRSCTFNIRSCNRTPAAIQVSVAIGSGASPALKDYITFNQMIPKNGIIEDFGLMASAGEKVWVSASAAGVSVRVHGAES